MPKKLKVSQQKKNIIIGPSQADEVFALINQQLIRGNYTEVVSNCKRLLSYLPKNGSRRIETLAILGTAYGILQSYPQAYEVLTEALELDPSDTQLWYKRGLASRFTSRFGRSYRDFERAIELNIAPQREKQLNDAFKLSQKLVEESIKERGPEFTLDQLIEQENHFHDGLNMMQARKWEEAIQAFKVSIAMGDCLPQPWGNLGICLMMLERYDEAEAAWKHALTLDESYEIAKHNLAMLPETRRTGPPKMSGIGDPVVNSNVKQELTFAEK